MPICIVLNVLKRFLKMTVKERKDKEHLIDYLESLKDRIHPVEWKEVKAMIDNIKEELKNGK